MQILIRDYAFAEESLQAELEIVNLKRRKIYNSHKNKIKDLKSEILSIKNKLKKYANN